MALTLLKTQSACPVGRLYAGTSGSHPDVLIPGEGPVAILVPSFAQALKVQQDLANAGTGLGVEVSTPLAWARDQWDLWGDGRRVVDAPARTLVMSQVLADAAKADARMPQPTPGTVRLLCQLAEACLPWVAQAAEDAADDLTRMERRVLGLLETYEAQLERHGLVEASTVCDLLPRSLKACGARAANLLLAGFSDLPRAQRELVCGMARLGNVVVLVRTNTEAARADAARLQDLLAREASAHGVAFSVADKTFSAAGDDAPQRCDELGQLCGCLFAQGATPVEITGAVRLLEPSGPLAQAELVARELERQASLGATSAVVAVPDVRRAWRELAPKLLARNFQVRAHLMVPVLQTEAGRAFMGYARTVATLLDLQASWPAPLQGSDGTYLEPGPMGWWPPQELVDFLLSDVSHTEGDAARNLDVLWRTNRLLSPADVLEQLLSAKYVGDAVERATRELLRGRLGSAASKLMAPYVQGSEGAAGAAATGAASPGCVSLAREEAVAALAAIMGVAGTCKDLGITADPAAERPVTLAQLVRQAEAALGEVQVSLRLCAGPKEGEAQATVELLGRSEAARLAPASVDVAVLCDLTSTDLAVPTGDDMLQGLLETLGLEPACNPLDGMRSSFANLCALPAKVLLLERPLFQADAHETYPAVMLAELRSCYDKDLPRATLSEDHARQNLSATGQEPACLGTDPMSAAGHIDPALSRLVVVPQEGKAELPGGLPVLSASQIESYLECPLKWFSLRRLRLKDNDALFSPLEMGTFAHRVLELTFAQLFQEGRAKLAASDASGLTHARQVLRQNFELHLQHQHMVQGNHAPYQALIAHNARDRSQVDRLLADLTSTLDYTSQRLEGFEPRAFEWDFGRGSAQAGQGGLPTVANATYAGVRVTGTVDRIDVNPAGEALIIDYKHKGPVGFFAEYAAFGKEGCAADGPLVLPRRIQALMYAQVVRRAFPDLRVVGALYLGTRGGHELSGAVAQRQVEPVFGGTLGAQREVRVAVPHDASFGLEGAQGMEALLDATEEAIARKVERLREEHIEADPTDDAACAFCPVANCAKRRMA